jgi:hypothetical protein
MILRAYKKRIRFRIPVDFLVIKTTLYFIVVRASFILIILAPALDFDNSQTHIFCLS